MLGGVLVFFIARWIESRLGESPDDFMYPNVIGASILAVLVLAGPQWVSAGASVFSGGAAVVALTISLASLQLSERNADQLQKQDERRYADKVYVGEPPVSVYESRQDRCRNRSADQPSCHRRGHPDQRIWNVIINASGAQAQDVWVASREGDKVIAIRGLERCSMYALPYEIHTGPGASGPLVPFEPTHLYFSDPNGYWHRTVGGPVDSMSEDAFNAALVQADLGNDEGDSPWTDVLPDCAG